MHVRQTCYREGLRNEKKIIVSNFFAVVTNCSLLIYCLKGQY